MGDSQTTWEVLPVKTRILTHNDNIVQAIKEYCTGQAGPNDVIAVAESVVAITQNRVFDIEAIKPGLSAKILCRFFPAYGSLGTRYSMQALIDEEGIVRVWGAFIVGAIGKVFGQKGIFYRLAGEQARLIDDITGTMPPYDKYIVMGPANPAVVVKEITQAMGCFGAAVTDVNDLKRAAILAASDGVDAGLISKILIDNPFGNASQKTPIVIIKNYNKK